MQTQDSYNLNLKNNQPKSQQSKRVSARLASSKQSNRSQKSQSNQQQIQQQQLQQRTPSYGQNSAIIKNNSQLFNQQKNPIDQVKRESQSINNSRRLQPSKSQAYQRQQSYMSRLSSTSNNFNQKSNNNSLLNSKHKSQNLIPKLQPKKEKEIDFDQILTSQWDKDMQKYRYKNPGCLEYERKEKIHRFIFEKKKQNSLKYSSKSKINVTALPVPRGTVSIMLNVDKKDYGFNLYNFKKKIPQKSKFKMKWKTIQWLLNNKKDAIKQLFNNYNLMLKYAKGKKDGMNRTEFGELLSYVGLGADQNLADKLFYIFDDDNSQSVDYKELIIGLETFKESTMDDKLKVFMEICDDDGNGKVTKDELYQVLKQNLFNYDDKVKLKEIVRNIFKENDVDKDGTLDKDELYNAVTTNQMLRQLLEESIKNVKRVDQMIENDLEEPFHAWVPISANFVNYKEGIHFKLVDKYLNAFDSIEQTHAQRKNMRNVYKDAMKLSKSNNGNMSREDNIEQVDSYGEDED